MTEVDSDIHPTLNILHVLLTQETKIGNVRFNKNLWHRSWTFMLFPSMA
jgi:hypothetical protein